MKEQYNVLCIGVNKVPGLNELNYAEKDAYSVAKYFKTLKSNADVTLLTGKNATREKILAWVEECGAIQEELTLIISFAGHGSAEKNEKTNSLERCLWIDGNFNAPFDSHRLKTSEILKLLNNPLHKLIFLIDACYDIDPLQRVSIQHIFKQFKESERIIGLKQYAVISASAANQVALEDPQVGHGVLTYYFLQTMAGKYSFFLRKNIPFFKVLATLDKKVRNHRFLTNTGRKVTFKILRENGIMVHWNDTNFELPVLEPIPYIEAPGKNVIQEKLYRWTHFFKRTRLRRKICRITVILAAALVLIILAHLSIVRIHFQYMGPAQKLRNPGPSYSFMQQTKFYNFLLGNAGLFLSGMSPERAGQVTEKNVTLFLFKHNWLDAILPKLDGDGKIILLGNYLGSPIDGVDETQLMTFALENNNRGCWFYWHPRDVNKLLESIQREYKHFDGGQKKDALRLLAELGGKGKDTAINIFDLKNETDQELRDFFLEHFYSARFWEQNAGEFGLYDYLCLINYDKPVPFPNTGRSGENAEKFLYSIVQSLPGAGTRITGTNKLSETYEKLKVLAYLGSPDFPRNASNILKSAFEPDFVLSLLTACKDVNHGVWLLEQYFRYIEQENIAEIPWEQWQSIEAFIKRRPVKEKGIVRKMLIDNVFQRIPKMGRHLILRHMHDSGPGVVSLRDWERWMKKYGIYPDYVLNSIVKLKYPHAFGFLEAHYQYFKGNISGYIFEDLYKRDNDKAIKLVKKLYTICSQKDKFHVAMFLYNKNCQEYSSFIVRFMTEGKDNHRQDILQSCYHGTLNETLIRIAKTNRSLPDDFKYLLKDRKLFYALSELSLVLWPEEAKEILVNAKIPYNFEEGIPYLRACEKLTEPYRKKKLIKICRADIDETFKLNADLSVLESYPRTFLEMANQWGYDRDQSKWRHVVDAYRWFSYDELRYELRHSFKMGLYGKIYYLYKALIKKETKGELGIHQLRLFLQEFNRPVERILLRDLRHYYHKRVFPGEKNGRAI